MIDGIKKEFVYALSPTLVPTVFVIAVVIVLVILD